jgi:hypothetical protein
MKTDDERKFEAITRIMEEKIRGGKLSSMYMSIFMDGKLVLMFPVSAN